MKNVTIFIFPQVVMNVILKRVVRGQERYFSLSGVCVESTRICSTPQNPCFVVMVVWGFCLFKAGYGGTLNPGTER